MSKSDTVVAVIPARGGSKGLPRKNISQLAGKPMIAWTIEMANSLSMIDRVIVSTEDDEIAQIANEWGAETPFFRPIELADDCASTESVLQHALNWLEEDPNSDCQIMFYMQVDCPYRSKGVLENVLGIIQQDESIDTVFPARLEHKNFWKLENGDYIKLDDRGHAPRQIKEHIFKEDTGTGCAIRSRVVKSGKRIGENVRIIQHDVLGQFVEFHSEFDMQLGNLLAEKLNILPNQP